MSNWAKYEIPNDDEVEDDQEKTGPDFEYVLSTAQGSEAHFIFKSEQEWVKEAGTRLVLTSIMLSPVKIWNNFNFNY